MYLFLIPKNEMNSRWLIKDLNVETKQNRNMVEENIGEHLYKLEVTL